MSNASASSLALRDPPLSPRALDPFQESPHLGVCTELGALEGLGRVKGNGGGVGAQLFDKNVYKIIIFATSIFTSFKRDSPPFP